MKNLKFLYCLVIACILSCSFSDAQVYRFRHYGMESGISNPFVYALNQDNAGYLWISTGAGLIRFDGVDYCNVAFPDSSASRYATVIFKDKNNTLWFGCDDGTVYVYSEGLLQQIKIKNSRSICEILESADGYIWIVPQGSAVYKIDADTHVVDDVLPLNKHVVVFSACFSTHGYLMLGTQDAVSFYSVSDSMKVVKNVEGFDYAGVNAIHQLGRDTYLIGTNGNGLYKMVAGDRKPEISKYDVSDALQYLAVRSFYQDSEGYIWVITNDVGVYRLLFAGEDFMISDAVLFDKNSGLAGNNVRTVFQDKEGDFWFGLFGNGLSFLNSMAFGLFSPGTTPETNNIIYINNMGDDIFWGTPTGFFLFNPEDNGIKPFSRLGSYVENEYISSYFIDDEQSLWIGTRGKGLFLKKKGGSVRRFYRSGDTSEDYISDIIVDDKHIWLGTINGVLVIDRQTGAFLKKFNIDNGLPHNSIENIILDKDGRCIVATKTDRLYYIDFDKGCGSLSGLMYGSTINSILSYCQDNQGNFWAATFGNGLFKLSGDSVVSYTRKDLLLSDYCYSLYVDRRNRLWIGHDKGFSRINLESNVIHTFGNEFVNDGVCNPDGIYETDKGQLFIGTTQGVVVYNANKDMDKMKPPVNNISAVTINNKRYPFKPSFVLPYKKVYNITVDYSGINLKDPGKVFYQTRLVNWTDGWTPWNRDRSVTYSPRDGRYTFEMKSINEAGLSEDCISFDIVIKKPFWRMWWFIVFLVSAIVGAMISIIKIRERVQKRREEYLTEQLDIRTNEVVAQKNELEIKNSEITDSINYAKKIQFNILPDFNKLKVAFNDAFIFFKPRDIVSGDFYWFENVSDNKFILVCADSTGHGVPGAFMSMIGITLLRDLVLRQHITKPSEILKQLDNQIVSSLNQYTDNDVANDGMDIVVCEIDIRERHLRFASAMRPVILVLKGESNYIRGNRLSVGGEIMGEKFFDDHDYFLLPDDSIYLFSDGFPDQFGGKDNKKLKISHFRALIDSIVDKPMDEQKETIAGFFEEWKGDDEQVDDVLLMGVRF